MTHIRSTPTENHSPPPALCPADPRAGRAGRAGRVTLSLFAGAWLLASCRAPMPPERPTAPPAPVPVDSLPGIATDPLDGVVTALAQQCRRSQPPDGWAGLCATLPDDTTVRDWLATRFLARELTDDVTPAGLVTGYYEPLLTGSLTQEHPAQVPLRSRPPDLLTIDLADVEPRLKGLRLRGRLDGQRVIPYYSRAETERRETRAGQAAGSAPGTTSGPVIGWADDPVDAFFLEIQGSGRLQLRDGRFVRVGYADQNGHPYRAIGRTLIDRGALSREQVTAPAIRQWLQQNPSTAPEVMQTNPSLVYFRALPPPVDPTLGPPGSLGVPLTPLRSIAVDRGRIPLGTLVYLQTTDPVTGQPLNRLTVAQDTGGAIRGTKRADLFWGFGPEAAEAAGRMKAPARMWVLEPAR